MTGDTITNSFGRMDIMLEMRAAGRPLPEIAKAVGISRTWACKLLKAAGAPLPDEITDKNGTKRHKHGMRHTSEYSSWISMRTRCCDPNHPTYKHYGARGITLDPRWLDFNNFYADMGPKPAKGYTIERKDTNQGYCKDNCIWLLKRLQNRNQRSTKLTIEKVREIRAKHASGQMPTALAKEYGVSKSMVGMIVNGSKWVEA